MSRLLSQSDIANAQPISMGEINQPHPGAVFRARYADGQEVTAPVPDRQAPPTEYVDPIEQTRADAFAEGFAAGSRVTRESFEMETQAQELLAAAIQQLAPAQSGALASMLSAAVVRLVGQIVGAAPVDPDLLRTRVEAVAAFIEAEQSKAALHVHPEDIALLEGYDIGAALIGDPSLGRGSVRLDTSEGWIEDGPDIQLARLSALLDDMEGRA